MLGHAMLFSLHPRIASKSSSGEVVNTMPLFTVDASQYQRPFEYFIASVWDEQRIHNAPVATHESTETAVRNLKL